MQTMPKNREKSTKKESKESEGPKIEESKGPKKSEEGMQTEEKVL